jgi:putative glycosyltransferase
VNDDRTASRPDISVVTTMYRSEPYIEEFYSRVVKTIRKLGIKSYEIVFVDDGSPDRSRDLALQLYAGDPSVVVVDLSRNFGHHKAIMTGLSYTHGRRIFLLDCDLEEDPELLEQLVTEMDRRGCDVVFCVQQERRGNWFDRVTGELYYRIMNAVSGIEFPRNVFTLRLMTRRYVDSLLLHRERELLISGIWHLTGYEQVAIPAVKHSRSPTSYPIHKRFALMVMSVISYSDRPLRWIFYTGVGILIFAAFYIAYLAVIYLLYGIRVSGYLSIIVSLWLIGGLNFLFLGTIGIYVATIFSETKQRPNTIVRAIYRRENEHRAPA